VKLLERLAMVSMVVSPSVVLYGMSGSVAISTMEGSVAISKMEDMMPFTPRCVCRTIF